MPSTFRFLHEFLRSGARPVTVEDTTYVRGGETLAASLYRPAGERRALPGWVALHGLTCRGRRHEGLDTFARALAASGTAVFVPDLPEWRRLVVAPTPTAETIRSAVLALHDRPETASGRVGVIGFSFGGTQALVASTDPALAGRVSAVASWGGYADMARAVRFMFVGEHTLDGRHYSLEPDPYGRWILAGNYLTGISQHRNKDAARAALHDLAREVGRRKLLAWLPETDPLKAERRANLSGKDREVFDLLAPPADHRYTPEERKRLDALADGVSRAAVQAEPLLDPLEALSRVPVPVFLAHARRDRLIPWTELERLRRRLPEERVRHGLVTSLFGHSFRDGGFPTPGRVLEGLRLVRAIHRMVHLV